MKEPAIIFDLDRTLSRTPHTSAKSPKDWRWNEFISVAKQSEVDPYMKMIWDAGMLGLTRIILTARPEKLRDMTYVWAKQHLNFLPEHDILMMMDMETAREQELIKETDDFNRFQGRFKFDQIERLQKEYKIVAFFDDKEEACDQVGTLGVRTFKVDLGI